jgi:hypothetical protein
MCYFIFFLRVKVQKKLQNQNKWRIYIGAENFNEVTHFHLVVLLKRDKVKL